MLKHFYWNSINKFGTQLISFTGNVIIARQLLPDDYGLIAMLAIFMSIAINFTDSGYADFLIRDANSDKKDFAVVFTHNLVFGIFFYFILFFTAPLIASFYEEPVLIEITRVLGLSIIFRAICLSEFTRMRKELLFKNLAVINITSILFSIIIAYLFAINGWGYWTLVIQLLSTGFINLVLIILFNKWRPIFYFNLNRYKRMRKFGNNMLISYLFNQFGKNLFSVIIGKFYSPEILGYFSQGEKISRISVTSINTIFLNTSYPILSRENDKLKRKAIYISIFNHHLFTHFSLSLILIGSAYQLIPILFGNQWTPTAPLLQLLLISYLFRPLITLNHNIIKVENKSNLYRNLVFLRNSLLLISLFLTYRYSISAIIYGQVVVMYISALISVIVCGRYVDLFIKEQLGIAIKQLIAPLISTILSYKLMTSLSFSENWQLLTVFIISFMFLFVAVNILTKNQSFFQAIAKLKFINN